MQGSIGFQGDLILALNKKDAKTIETSNTLECKVLARGRKQTLKLLVQEKVSDDKSAFEPGFSVNSYPRESDFETREGVKVCISKENYQKLLQKEYVGTRWANGIRVDITYCG